MAHTQTKSAQFCDHCDKYFREVFLAREVGHVLILHTDLDSLIRSTQTCCICSAFRERAVTLPVTTEVQVRVTVISTDPAEPKGRSDMPSTTLICMALRAIPTIPYTDQLIAYEVRVDQAPDRSPLVSLTDRDVYTSDALSLSTIKSWLHQCTLHHHICRPPDSTAFLPQRLIDVGVGSSSSSLSLVLTRESGITGPYISLSHCWGQGVSTRLLVSNLEEFKGQIPTSQLSRTFKEAISLTRSLGVRYLWIDALCIIQDLDADWEAEAPLMAQVFGNALCCIAATWASNGDGLFSKRVDSCNINFSVKDPGSDGFLALMMREVPIAEELITSGPLNRRAWVFQERILSPRIVHFAQGQLFWECRELCTSERMLHDWQLAQHSSMVTRFGSRAPAIASALKLWNKSAAMDEWHQVTLSYSRSRLTRRSDRIAAISGISQLFSESVKGHYIAGIWQAWVLQDLLWRADHATSEPVSDFIPSFCWTSLNVGVSWNPPPDRISKHGEPLAEVREFHVTEDSDASPFVQPRTGSWLLMRAHPFRARLFRFIFTFVDYQVKEIEARVWLDRAKHQSKSQRPHSTSGESLYLPLRRDIKTGDVSTMISGIVIEPVSDGNRKGQGGHFEGHGSGFMPIRYRRIGQFMTQNNSIRKGNLAHSKISTDWFEQARIPEVALILV